MELEDLKQSVHTGNAQYSEAELQSIFTIKTKGTVRHLNKKMLMDATIMIVVTGLLIAATFYLGIKSRYTVSALLVGMSALLLIHFQIKKYLLGHSVSTSRPVLQGLKRTVRILKSYIIGYYITIPALTILMFHAIGSALRINTSEVVYIAGLLTGTLLCYVTVRLMYADELKRLITHISQFEALSSDLSDQEKKR